MNTQYKPHTLEWTDEKVARFWNFRNNYKPYDDTWFTEKAGKALLNLVKKHVSFQGRVLDYGTGKGFLLQHILNENPSIELYACDFTDSLAKETALKYKAFPAFKGCNLLTQLPSSYESDFFDIVFLIETIEHLTDNYLHGTLQEINRILKPGGVVVITTPFDEDLARTFVHCADCGATFHHMQHVRSWNVSSLTNVCNGFNFSTVWCKGINIKWYSMRGFFHYASDQLKKIFAKPVRENLVYIGSKK